MPSDKGCIVQKMLENEQAMCMLPICFFFSFSVITEFIYSFCCVAQPFEIVSDDMYPS